MFRGILSSTSLPGGNQVDGLPPASSVLEKIHSTVKFLMISDFDIRKTPGFFRKYFSALRASNPDYRDLRLKSQIRVELG